MRRLAIALVAAISVGAAVPAMTAVDFSVGSGGVSVGVGPGFYGYYGGHFHAAMTLTRA
jgi:hypothetical protein